MLINGAWKRQKLVQPKAQAVAHTISCNFWKIWHYLFDEVWMGAHLWICNNLQISHLDPCVPFEPMI